MKKTLIVAAVAIAVLAFCGCASTSSGTTGISSTATGVSSSATATTTQQADALLDDDELEDEEDTVDIDYDLAEYTMDGTMNGGYSYEATLKIGPWVKASDTETINEIWEEIGGSGSVPDIDTFTRNNWSSGIHFSEGSSMMAFGTISVTDTTQGGFSIGDSSLNLNISVYSDELGGDNLKLMCDSYIDYTGGSGNRYLHSIEGGRAGKRILDVVPNMTGTRNWGPVPFVICCNEAITPEYPNGDPDAMSATWSFGDNRFKLNFISDDGTIITPSEIASDDEFADFDEDEDVYEDEDEGDYDYDYEDDYEDEDFDD